jgi:hypothetical protein
MGQHTGRLKETSRTTAWMQEVEQCRSNCREFAKIAWVQTCSPSNRRSAMQPAEELLISGLGCSYARAQIIAPFIICTSAIPGGRPNTPPHALRDIAYSASFGRFLLLQNLHSLHPCRSERSSYLACSGEEFLVIHKQKGRALGPAFKFRSTDITEPELQQELRQEPQHRWWRHRLPSQRLQPELLP